MKRLIFVICLAVLFLGYVIYRIKFFAPRKYNVILISIDLLQAKHLQAYGYYLNSTPNLTRFFEKSYLFTNAIAPSSWTMPSTMSVFTSLYPNRHSIILRLKGFYQMLEPYAISYYSKLKSSFTTFIEVLETSGYEIVEFGKAKYYYAGFDLTKLNESKNFSTSIPRTIEWLKKNKEKKFFLYLQSFDLHSDFDLREGYSYQYIQSPHIPNKETEKDYTSLQKKVRENKKISKDEIDFWNGIYDEKINKVDSLFGNFFSYIEETGLMKNTIIILLSAHGIEYYEHKDFNHGHTLYQEVIHVPLAIHMPGQKNGRRIQSLVSLIDVAPTILSALKIRDISFQKQMQGIDLTPSFYGKDISRNVFSEIDFFNPNRKKIGIITKNGWKFISDTSPQPVKELYFLKTDPEELQNLMLENPKNSYFLEQELFNFLKN